MRPFDRLVDRRRPELDRLHEKRRGACHLAAVPGPPGVVERVFERGRTLAPAARIDRRLAQRAQLELTLPAGTREVERFLESALGLRERARTHERDRELEEGESTRG